MMPNDLLTTDQPDDSNLQHPDKPEEACGVFGIYAPGEDVAKLTYFGLYALQHRGQESAGIATFDSEKLHLHKDMGLVSQVFNESILSELTGNLAVGHTRYSTTGSSRVVNAQPAIGSCRLGAVAVAHNGNLVNTSELREEMTRRQYSFVSTTDTELIALAIASEVDSGKNWLEGCTSALKMCEGAFSLAIGTPAGLFGTRDPHGIRPLVIGTLEGNPTRY
ncbi:MAG: class II glutamine amidotransferase, partial [Cyanobacteriota bacterium]|nr:class II glutamine amidotransferase [Cyanobacteriota bacterium]